MPGPRLYLARVPEERPTQRPLAFRSTLAVAAAFPAYCRSRSLPLTS
jgi:hypothetical protein